MKSESVQSILARQEDYQKQATGSNTNIVDKDGFLKLLITQMQHQDPFSPMDNEQMMSQMAQFSSLEQMQSINANLASSLQWDLLFNQTINNTMATSLIGREVEALGRDVVLKAGGTTTVKYSLGALASDLTAEVRNAAGDVIYSAPLGAQDAGSYEWTWDGTDLRGVRQAAGVYQIQIVAQDASGASVAVDTYRLGRVDSVEYVDGNAYLLVDGQRIALGDIQRISKSD
jgi:flagellar basal-body rod modification protein FlgD